MHDTITIRILGQEYKVKTGGNEEHIQSLSHYVNKKVFDVQQQGSAISTMELIAMVMLDLADEVAKAKSELKEYKESVSEKVDQILVRIDQGTR
ncbi:MAG TPA: cell division protein ZapA [Deltaproteobacteria bacterium]|nr:cell division protein ZapA [Deltaproteobacteria bacterium]HOI07079.1 cell division protein ZapA [Deltaproteobacteria bacterium]